MIRDMILVKYYQMNIQSETKNLREDKPLYIKSKYKDTCTPFFKYRHKVKNRWHIESVENLPDNTTAKRWACQEIFLQDNLGRKTKNQQEQRK